ncbi:MAG: transglycosylase domain-containing protein [bacterium]|nr:transglycosylase domain-containing protein [bacterium]
MESQPKRFAHTCRSCGGRYNVLIRVEVRRVHQASCPHCSEKNFFDNRDGRLAGPPKKKRRAAPARANSAGQPRSQTRAPNTGERKRPAAAAPSVSNSDAPVDFAPRLKQSGKREASSKRPAALSGGDASLRDFRELKPRPPSAPAGDRPMRRRVALLDRGPGRYLPDDWRDALAGLFARLPRDWNDALDSVRGRWGVLLLTGAACGMIGIGVGWISLQFPGIYLSEPAVTYLDRLQVLQPNRVLDRNGQLIAELFSERTGGLTVETLPRPLADTLIFTEDQSFYSHGGVHWPSIFRAFIANLFAGGYSQGGSTLTQQLARILLNDREKSIFRKLRETALAYELESQLTKDQILVGYMNHVYLGHGSLGFEPAARFYFEKAVEELTFEERLALVCLPSAPNRYSPLRNPDQLRNKMDAVYTRMLDDDFKKSGGLPAPEAYRVAATDMLRSLDKSPGESVFGNRVNEAPYVSEYIRQKLVQLLGKSYEYGQGIQIYTTIDRKLQLAADRQSREFVRQKAPAFPPVKMKDGKRVYTNSMRDKLLREYGRMAIGPELFGIPAPARVRARLQTASIGLETRTGRVVFMQGGADFTSGNQLNRALQMRRQTGSAVKPFVYSAGIESGQITAGTLLDDRPIFVSLNKIARNREKDYWLPGNYSGVFEGEILVRRALERSQNIPAIQVARRVGITRLGQQFRKFFFYRDSEFKRRFREDDTVAIGSLEMSPLELVTAFTAFGNGGVIRRPHLIRKIVNARGEELWSAGASYDEFALGVPVERRVLPGDVAEVMVSLLGSSAKFGGVAKGGFSSPHLIGKTGTSNEYRDAWFVGSTPDITTVVWMGFDQPAYSMPGGTGAGLAGPLWGRIMKAAPPIKQRYSFSPRAVKFQICKTTGRKPTEMCPTIVKEIFVKAHPPEDATEADRLPPGRQTGPDGRESNDPDALNQLQDGSNAGDLEDGSDFSVNSDSDFD